MAIHNRITTSFVEEIMKQLFFVIVLCIFTLFFTFAQQKNLVPLLGSTQDFTKSPFCKKYKCIAKYTGEFKVFSHFVLSLPDDDPAFYEDFGQTTIFLKEDKKKQLAYIGVTLIQKSKSSDNADPRATIMLLDLVYYAVGKKFSIFKDRFGDFSPEINDCFYKAQSRPKENIEELTRISITGEITLEIDKKKVKYQATCSRFSGGRTPELYTPGFTIKIPSIKDSQKPAIRYRY
jgi:hypothetical protein